MLYYLWENCQISRWRWWWWLRRWSPSYHHRTSYNLATFLWKREMSTTNNQPTNIFLAKNFFLLSVFIIVSSSQVSATSPNTYLRTRLLMWNESFSQCAASLLQVERWTLVLLIIIMGRCWMKSQLWPCIHLFMLWVGV